MASIWLFWALSAGAQDWERSAAALQRAVLEAAPRPAPDASHPCWKRSDKCDLLAAAYFYKHLMALMCPAEGCQGLRAQIPRRDVIFRGLTVSETSPEGVQRLFSAMKDNYLIPFEHLSGQHCFMRAAAMTQGMVQLGLRPLTVQVEGDMNLRFDLARSGSTHWSTHIAVLVAVRAGGRSVPYVIDPSVAPEAVPLEEWKRLLTDLKLDVADFPGGRIDKTSLERPPSFWTHLPKKLDFDGIHRALWPQFTLDIKQLSEVPENRYHGFETKMPQPLADSILYISSKGGRTFLIAAP